MWERMSEAPVADDVQDGRTTRGRAHGGDGAAPGPHPLRRSELPRRSRPSRPNPRRRPAHLAAEMPDNVVVETDFVISVRLSRNAIVPTAGAVHAGGRRGRRRRRGRSSVQVVGKKNVRLAGTGADVFALPPGGGTSELTFTAQALAPGAVRREDRGQAGHASRSAT